MSADDDIVRPEPAKAGKAKGGGGCDVCGLMGCDCNPAVISQPRGKDVCRGCRRAIGACICQSHVRVREVHDFGKGERVRPMRPYPAKYVEVLVNDAMLFYYNRDAEGLARFVRKLAQEDDCAA